jgi:cyclopropane fatty-acyl-phospholipid synthase-like methyltransferase
MEDEKSRSLFDAVFDATGVGAGIKFLDIGCGSGLACTIAADRGANVCGLDASPGLLAIARQRVPPRRFPRWRHGVHVSIECRPVSRQQLRELLLN